MLSIQTAINFSPFLTLFKCMHLWYSRWTLFKSHRMCLSSVCHCAKKTRVRAQTRRWVCAGVSLFSPPSSPRSLPSYPGSAQPMNQFPGSTKKYSNPAMIPDSFSTTVDSRGSQSNLPSSRSSSSLSLASTLSPQQTGSLNVGRLEPSIQTPPEGSDASSELFSPST